MALLQKGTLRLEGTGTLGEAEPGWELHAFAPSQAYSVLQLPAPSRERHSVQTQGKMTTSS